MLSLLQAFCIIKENDGSMIAVLGDQIATTERVGEKRRSAVKTGLQFLIRNFDTVSVFAGKGETQPDWGNPDTELPMILFYHIGEIFKKIAAGNDGIYNRNRYSVMNQCG